MISITPIYAAVLSLVFLTLSIRVIRYRRANQLSLGDEGDRGLLRLMRAQANCGEYLPIGVLMILLAELQGWPAWALHLSGLALLLGRVAHGYGFSAKPMIMQLRVLGMALTLTQIAVTAIGILLVALVAA